jgi:hypothetical protein
VASAKTTYLRVTGTAAAVSGSLDLLYSTVLGRAPNLRPQETILTPQPEPRGQLRRRALGLLALAGTGRCARRRRGRRGGGRGDAVPHAALRAAQALEHGVLAPLARRRRRAWHVPGATAPAAPRAPALAPRARAVQAPGHRRHAQRARASHHQHRVPHDDGREPYYRARRPPVARSARCARGRRRGRRWPRARPLRTRRARQLGDSRASRCRSPAATPWTSAARAHAGRHAVAARAHARRRLRDRGRGRGQRCAPALNALKDTNRAVAAAA